LWKEFVCCDFGAVEAIKTKGPNGYLPLHIAVLCGYIGVNTICTLLSWFPSAIHCHNDKGQFLLHVACKGNAILDVILLLMELYPRAIGKIGSYGKIPSNYIVTLKFCCQLKLKK